MLPTDTSRHRDRCALCGGGALDTVLSLVPTPPGNAYQRAPVARGDGGEPPAVAVVPLDLARCRTCGHVQLLDIVNRIDILGRPAAALSASPRRRARSEAFARRLMARLDLARDALVVDIGANDGSFLKLFEGAGQRVQGIEPAVNVAREAIGRGIETHPGLFSPAIADLIEERRGRAQLIVAHQAFAEATDPVAFLDGVRALLTRDGVLAIAVDDLDALIAGGRADRIDHRSLHYFQLSPLRRLLAACDLELFAAEHAEPDGVLYALAQRLGGPRADDGSVARLLAADAAGVAETADRLAAFARRLAAIGGALRRVIGDERASGGRVAAVGTGCGATTLLYQFGLDRHSIDVIADIGDAQAGLYSPGLNIPVRPLSDLIHRPPGLILLLSTEGLDDALDELAPLRRPRGPRFLVALPEPHLLS